MEVEGGRGGPEGFVDEDTELPRFAAMTAMEVSGGQKEERKVAVPPNRLGALKRDWATVYTPIVDHLKLQIRMNLHTRKVEIRTSPHTEDSGALQRAEDFLRAYMLGFDVEDAMALLRMDDLYIDSFEVTDVKRLQGDNLARAVGRIAGHQGRTKFAIENSTRTRIVLADTKIHILGTVDNIRMAKDAICSLILGSPPGKVYAKLRDVSSRSRQNF